jgi:hypothetical protein
MKAWIVRSKTGRYLGRVLGRDEEDALKRARDFWPREKGHKVKLWVP